MSAPTCESTGNAKLGERIRYSGVLEERLRTMPMSRPVHAVHPAGRRAGLHQASWTLGRAYWERWALSYLLSRRGGPACLRG
jgi:hypothetical protein